MDELQRLLRDTDSEIFEAVRKLAEVEASEALHAVPHVRAKYASALSHLVQARGQLARLHDRLGAVTVEAAD
jgi:hypothetical protein